MVTAVWNNAKIASSQNSVVVEGNHYFPPADVNKTHLQASDTHTRCPWKGLASYYDVVVEGVVNADAAWYYPQPSEKAKHIKDYVAFWKGVEIVED